MGAKKPDWLARAEHGSVGEARTKAFLADRFWVLERSVDVDGADFLIQRRILGVNAPALGIVQVKYFQNERTTQYVHKEYVCDNNNKPRTEFFLMCHTGEADEARRYLLHARDIVRDFKIAPKDHTQEGKYIIPGIKIVKDKTYEIISAANTLKYMEWDLETTELKSNRQFVSYMFPVADPTDAIDSAFRIDLDNESADIPESMAKLKRKTQSLIFDLEDMIKDLNKILIETDPEEALELVECLDLDGHRRISFSCDLYDEYLHDAVEEHKRQYDILRSLGVLDAFLKIKEECDRVICEDLLKRGKLEPDLAQTISIKYNIQTLEIERIIAKIVNGDNSTQTAENCGLLINKKGLVKAYWKPGTHRRMDIKNGKLVNIECENWQATIADGKWKIIRPIMRAILDFCATRAGPGST